MVYLRNFLDHKRHGRLADFGTYEEKVDGVGLVAKHWSSEEVVGDGLLHLFKVVISGVRVKVSE